MRRTALGCRVEGGYASRGSAASTTATSPGAAPKKEASTHRRRTAGATHSPPPYLTIPKWYHFGMTTQIAVRLPDDLVEFVDGTVRRGDAPSRAAVVSRALERERRRAIAERDAVILASAAPDSDLDGLADYAAAAPMDDLD
jgi:Arc/MetJ-type ribon-helix-helix transcriptional regulator